MSYSLNDWNKLPTLFDESEELKEAKVEWEEAKLQVQHAVYAYLNQIKSDMTNADLGEMRMIISQVMALCAMTGRMDGVRQLHDCLESLEAAAYQLHHTSQSTRQT